MSNPPLAIALSVSGAEERARAFLAQGKWRHARDELKPLVKADRARFLPLLIQANIGLARKMLANGQAAEARQVLHYLATIAPADQLRAFELELAVKSGVAGQSLPKFIAALADTRAPLADAERVRLADAVVLAFEAAPAGDPARQADEARLARELRAVHDALQALAQAQWPVVADALRLVPHRSAFSHWAVFIKGVAAFHTGDMERAAQLLRSLPRESVPTNAGQPYLLLAGGPAAGAAGPPISEAALEGICRLVGAPGTAGILWRADKLWRDGMHTESYRALRDGVAHFPSTGLDWAGAVTEFYFKAPHSMAQEAWIPFLHYFTDLIDRGRLKQGVEAMRAYQMLALMGRAIATADELRGDWEEFLHEHRTIHGANPRLESLAYGWLGEQLAMTLPSRSLFPTAPRLRDPPGAMEALRKSIELDHANLAAHLQLAAVYDALKKKSERNRLFDDMTARFPDDKKVLVYAARGCIERKAYAKGLDYLARARHLDQLDPQIPEAIASALRAMALQQFEQHRPQKARLTLARIEELLIDQAGDFQRSRWTARTRYGVMELLWGDAARAAALLAESRALAPGGGAHLLFAHLIHRQYAKARRCESPFLPELRQTLRRKGELRLPDIALLVRLVDFWRQAADTLRLYEEEKLVGDALGAAADQPFTRAEAVAVIEPAGDCAAYAIPIRKLVKKILHADPQDPLFRFFQCERRDARSFSPPPDRAELESILAEANRRRDEAATRKIRRKLQEIDHPPPPPFDPYFDVPDAPDEAFDPFDEAPPDFPPELAEQFAELIEALRTASPAAVRALRRSLPRDLPDFLFDELVKMAKSGALPPSPPLPPAPRSQPVQSMPAPRPKPAKPAPDPNQLNFF